MPNPVVEYNEPAGMEGYSIEVVEMPEDVKDELQLAEVIGLDKICRLCARTSDHLIPIYEGEGLEYELEGKLKQYFPFQIEKNESMPVNCCYQCASTLLAWHELVQTSIEADRRLRALDSTTIIQINQKSDSVDADHNIEVNPIEVKLDIDATSPSIIENRIDDYFTIKSERANFEVSDEDSIEKSNSKSINSTDKRNQTSTRRVGRVRRFYCDICDTGFDSHEQMLTHHNDHTDQTLNQSPTATEKCKSCEFKFETVHDLQRHRRLRHPDTIVTRFKRRRCDIVAQYMCDVCGKGFTRNYDMLKHRKQAHADVPEYPNKKRNDNAELLARCRIEHDGKVVYKCEHCTSVIHLSYNFIRHQTIHTGVRAFFCHLCGKSFRMSSGLNRHIKELHYGLKKYPCEVCGRFFASKNSRDDHMNIHTGVRPFVCDQCGKSFKQKASLHVHKIFHKEDRPFHCGTCGKQFRRSSELKVHGYLHTGHKPHTCETCGTSFRLAQDLKRHMKIHTKEFEVQCGECGASFGQERYLKSHLKTHRKRDVGKIEFLEEAFEPACLPKEGEEIEEKTVV